jgi:hypothetical protein
MVLPPILRKIITRQISVMLILKGIIITLLIINRDGTKNNYDNR